MQPSAVQEAQRGGPGRPRAQRHLLLQLLQAAPELRPPAAGTAVSATGHGPAPRPAPFPRRYLCFSNALCTDLRERAGRQHRDRHREAVTLPPRAAHLPPSPAWRSRAGHGEAYPCSASARHGAIRSRRSLRSRNSAACSSTWMLEAARSMAAAGPRRVRAPREVAAGPGRAAGAPIGRARPRGADVGAPGKQLRAGKLVLQI